MASSSISRTRSSNHEGSGTLYASNFMLLLLLLLTNRSDGGFSTGSNRDSASFVGNRMETRR